MTFLPATFYGGDLRDAVNQLGASYVSGLVANDITAAAANTALIQAALDAAASSSGYFGTKTTVALPANLGVIYIAKASGGAYALAIGSNTRFDLNGNTLRRSANADYSLITTKSYLASGASVTLTYTSGNTVSVAWTAHGKIAGDHVCLYGGSPATYVGCFLVKSVTDANNIVVQLQYTPSASPTGTWSAKSPTRNFDITNGCIDWNYRGVGGTAGLGTMAVLLGYAQGWTYTNIVALDSLKYTLFAFHVADYHVADIRINSNSDGIHVFGPSFNAVIERVSGRCADDCVAVSSRDVHSIYTDISAGDILNFMARDINSLTTDTTAVCQMYSNVGFKMRGVVFDGVLGHAQCAVRIWGDNDDGGAVEDVTIRRMNAIGALFIANYIGPATPTVTIQKIVLDNCGLNAEDTTTAALTFGNATVIKHLMFKDCSFGLTPNTSVFLVGGTTVEHITFQGGRYVMSSNANLLRWTANRGVKKVTFDSVNIEGGNAVVNLPAAVTDNPFISMVNCSVKGIYDVFAISCAATIYTAGNMFQSISGAVSHGYNSANLIVEGGGGDSINGVFASSNELVMAAGTVTVRSFDRKVNITATGISKTAGAYAYSTTAAGTIAANRLVACNGTSWFDICDPTKTY